MLLLPGMRWKRPHSYTVIVVHGIDYETNRVLYHFSTWGNEPPVTIETRLLVEFIRGSEYERIEDVAPW